MVKPGSWYGPYRMVLESLISERKIKNEKVMKKLSMIDLAPRVMSNFKSEVMLEKSAWANRIRCEFIFSLDRLLRFRYRSIDNGFKLINNN